LNILIMQKELLSLLGGLISTTLSAKSSERQGSIESRTARVESDDFKYQVYVPAQMDNRQNLPLIVFLHGIGQRGSGGFVPVEGTSGALARHYLAQVPALILLPQCRPGSYWSDPLMEKMVMREIMQTVREFSADAKRVYLTGVSMGGYGVWHFALRHSEKFAALISICGGSPITIGSRFSPIAEKIGKTPAWLFHGADDKIVPVSESRQIVEALKANGGNVKYNEYPGVGHHVWMNALTEKELMPWLLAQRLG
jgi:predicted peptidase